MKSRDFSQDNKLSILLTHTHWDHIQGFPFFTPAYLPTSLLEIYGETKTVLHKKKNDEPIEEVWDIEKILTKQQGWMYFPVSVNIMASRKKYYELSNNSEYKINSVRIKTLRMYHPSNTLGFRFEFDEGGSFCFCTDVEHNDEMIKLLTRFARGVDVFAYDSQYHQKEYENGKQGWGHSTYYAGSKIANDAHVKEYHLIHHDPTHSDSTIKSIEASSKKLFKNSFAVPEGHTITF